MRAVFLLLLLVNLLTIAVQFPPIRAYVFDAPVAARPAQLNAEKLRIVRDTSNRFAVPPAPVPTP